MFSFPQDIFPKYPGEQRHHVGAILPFDKKDLTSTGRLPTSSNSFGCNYSIVGLSVKPAQGAQPQRSVPPTQASEKAKGHRAGLRKHVLLLSRCWRRAMFRVHQCFFLRMCLPICLPRWLVAKRSLPHALVKATQVKSFGESKARRYYVSTKVSRQRHAAKKTMVCLKACSGIPALRHLQLNSKIESPRRRNAHFHSWVTRLPIEMNVHVANLFWRLLQIPAFCLLASKIRISNSSPLQGCRVNRLPCVSQFPISLIWTLSWQQEIQADPAPTEAAMAPKLLRMVSD